MTCTEFEMLLDDYLNGELSDEARRSVEEHVSSCLVCRRALDELRSLLEDARRLPNEIEPDETLWPGIEARIMPPPALRPVADDARPESSRWSIQWNPLAAAAVLLLAVAVPLTLWQRGPAALEESPAAQADRVATSAEWPAGVKTAMLARTEDRVLLPRTDLLETLERQRGSVATQTLTTIEENAQLIDQAIAQLRAALDESPGDRQLELMLAARYQQEVALLKRVNRV